MLRFATLLRREPRALTFGLLHTIAATVGQTFVIALFLPGIKASFGLGDASISLIFTGTTLASAIVLWNVGHWLDRTDLLRYSIVCGAFLAISCAIVGASRDVALLVFGILCLRLSGNGLLTHVAVTATARYFTRERGRALSLVLLGSSIGEGGLPAPFVMLIAAWGWRWSIVAAGCFGFLLVIAAAAAVRRHGAFREPRVESVDTMTVGSHHRAHVPSHISRAYFVLTGPLFIAMHTVITAAIFHQALIAEAKGVSLQWFAVSFIAFAVARVVTALFMGPLVDRLGSEWLFNAHLLPLAAGTAALIVFAPGWIVPAYWLAAGVTGGMGMVLQATVVAEHVAPERLGSARGILGAVTIVASAAGPSLYGFGIAAGASVSTLLWCSVAALLGASLLGTVATRRALRGRVNVSRAT